MKPMDDVLDDFLERLDGGSHLRFLVGGMVNTDFLKKYQ